MTRISILTPDDMNDEQRAVIDASKANGKPHGGPFWAYIRNPKLMQTVQNIGACIADSTLSSPRTADRHLDRGAVLGRQIPVGRSVPQRS